MSQRSNGEALVVVVFLAVFVLVSAAAHSLGLDVTTLLKVGAWLLLVTVAAGLGIYLEIPFRWVLPAFLVAAWVCLWPALDYYATSDLERHLGHALPGAPWYGSWYAKLGVAFALGLTYLIPHQLSRRY